MEPGLLPPLALVNNDLTATFSFENVTLALLPPFLREGSSDGEVSTDSGQAPGGAGRTPNTHRGFLPRTYRAPRASGLVPKISCGAGSGLCSPGGGGARPRVAHLPPGGGASARWASVTWAGFGQPRALARKPGLPWRWEAPPVGPS